MMKKIAYLSAGILMAACSASAVSETYRITAEGIPGELEGKTMFLVNQAKEKLDSAVVENSSFIMEGTVTKPVTARLMAEGKRFGGILILEPGDITLTDSGVIGGALNKALADYDKADDAYSARFAVASTDAERQAIMKEYLAMSDSVLEANANNPVGEIVSCNTIYGLSLEELQAKIAKYPAMGELPQVQKFVEAAKRQLATQPGNKFLDFTITNESGSQSLSDYVGKGKPVLVDFWASWCGPCIRETAVLKELLAEYGDKGLEVLGVAVWDKPEDTLAAIEQHQLPWQQIINAQTIPTDLYGIAGIPCIMLIAPDGTIVSRDLQDNALRQSVKEFMDSIAAQ